MVANRSSTSEEGLELAPAAVRMFAVNERLNQMMLEQLDAAAWRAPAPGRVRTIAAIFTHMHNVRTKWVRLTAPHLSVPAHLNRARCTPQQAREALAKSAACCCDMLAEALGGGGARVKVFRRDGWARPWPAGVEMLCYMLAHEAHHRGQVAMLAHQVGSPLPKEVGYGMWDWEKVGRLGGARFSMDRAIKIEAKQSKGGAEIRLAK